MKVLVTGAAGYLGSILVPELLRAGHSVKAVDNFIYHQTSLLDVCYDEKLTVIRGDVRDRGRMREWIKDADFILPLACLTGAPACERDPIGARTTNLEAIAVLLQLRGQGQNVIFPTTNSGYGIGQTGIHCDEKTPLNPISLYGRLKVDAERAVLEAGHSVTLRFATVFGVSPRMRLDLLVNDFVYRAIHDRFVVLFEADFKRNYIHVRDVARAFLHTMGNFEKMKGEPYNVGLSDCNLNKRELCGAIKLQIPEFHFMESKVGEDPDKRNYIVSNVKFEATGFAPMFSLQKGIAELLRGYQIVKRDAHGNT